MIINKDYRTISTKYGEMLINRHEYGLPWSLEKEGEWAPVEIEFLMQFCKGIVYDIGANIGTHTLAFARTAEHVCSFEPQLLTYYTLCANLLLNNVFNVAAHNFALGSFTGSIPMWTPDPTTRNASAGIAVGEGQSTVAITTLDALDLPTPYFIKIDVEGHELEVLRGATKTLRRVNFVYVEIHRHELIAPIVELMSGLGFKGNEAIKTRIVVPLEEEGAGTPLFDVYGYLFIGKDVVLV